MALPGAFPIYPTGIDFNVSLGLPGPSSGILKSIDKTGISALMVPTVDFLIEFIKGNLGISDGMKTSTMHKNMNSPIASSDEMVFRSFSKTNKLGAENDINSYKSGDKFNIPKDKIKLSPEDNQIGIKGLETTTLKSIFETQKPYMEVASLVIGNLAKMEDVCARVMPLLGVPLFTKSRKPKGNSGQSGPKAVGYQSGAELKKELSRLESVKNQGGSINLPPGLPSDPPTISDATVIRSDNSTPSIDSGSTISNNYTWEIMSTVYSTGLYDPKFEYTYSYINLPPDPKLPNDQSSLNLDTEIDPYQKYKPEKIIFGIYNSKGIQFDPLEKLKGIDFSDPTNQVITPFDKAGWIINSPKWIFDNKIQNYNGRKWPIFGNPTYVTDYYDNDGNRHIKYYTSGMTNVLNGSPAIAGQPIITGFQSNEVNEYKDFFNDLISYKMLQDDTLKQSERDSISNEVSGILNIPAHLENVVLWGQGKSSVYKKIQGISDNYFQDLGMNKIFDNPFPRNSSYSGMVKSFKPFKIWSESASNDIKLREYAASKGKNPQEAGWIWIDPESDYLTKVIRIDPTTKIKYQFAAGEPLIESEIKSFIKNITIFEISDGREFNVEVWKKEGPNSYGNGPDTYTLFDTASDVSSYNLENWDFNDNDGILGATFGEISIAPEYNNGNSFKMQIWSETPTNYYNTGESYYMSSNQVDNILYINEVEKIDNKWTISNSFTDFSTHNFTGIQETPKPGQSNIQPIGNINPVNYLSSGDLIDMYVNYRNNPSYTKSVSINARFDPPLFTGASGSQVEEFPVNNNNTTLINTFIINAVDIFSNREYITQDGKQRLGDKSLVEVENGIITKWYYMTPTSTINTQGVSLINGSYSTPIDGSGGYTTGDLDNKLTSSGKKKTISIDINTIGGGYTDDPVESDVEIDIDNFQIRVKDNDSTGRIIDPSKILNEQLTSNDVFSNGKYGHGAGGTILNPDGSSSNQEIEVIKRFMLTELDTESYYIIEGILPDSADENGEFKTPTSISNTTGSGSSGGFYKLPDAIGSMKAFTSMLGDIFSKLIPTIIKIIALFKNPASFVTTIVGEKIEEGFSFASKESGQSFSQGKIKKNNVPKGKIPEKDEPEKERKVRDVKNHFKSSPLNNYVHVSDNGDFGSVLDGVAGIPFSLFGKSAPFGIQMDSNKMPSSPLSLVFPSKMDLSKVKNLQTIINPIKSDTSINLGDQLGNDVNNPSNGNTGSNQNGGISGNNDTSKTGIKFEDGTSIFIENNSLRDYIRNNESRYNFIYVSENIRNKIKEVDDLIETGTEENLLKALVILDEVSNLDPDNKAVDERKSDISKKVGNTKAGEQPLLKIILGLVTLPIKILAGIVEWIMNFFKSITNPLTLPAKLVEFLSFSWIMQFFTPKGLLEMIGIKFKPEKVAVWMGLLASGVLPTGADLADFSEFLSLSFGVKLPTYTKEQYEAIDPKMPFRLIISLFCFIEKIINGIIDFIWSTLGIEAIIPPPHIKLCQGDHPSDKRPEDISKVFNDDEQPTTEYPNDNDISNGLDTQTNEDKYKYIVELENGDRREFLNKEDLDNYIDGNDDVSYNFTF